MWNNERDRTQILAGIDWAVRIGRTLDDAGPSLLETARDAMGADACSVFVLDAAGDELRGARGTWDWTRSSFGARLEHWPNVRAVIESQIPAHVNGNNARRRGRLVRDSRNRRLPVHSVALRRRDRRRDVLGLH